MALISELYLCKNTKLFPGSEDSYYFASENARKTFFVGKSSNALHFTALSYIRETRAVRIPVNIETAEECDYMIFCNADYGNKWYYCFVDECRYINDATTEVSFIIDPVQTWLPSCTLSSCMINRRTLNSDTKWSNILNKEDFVTGSLYPTAQGTLSDAYSSSSYGNEYICVVSNSILAPTGAETQGRNSFYAKFNDRYANNCGRGDNLIYYVFNKSILGSNSEISKLMADLVAETTTGSLFEDNYKVFAVMMIPELVLPPDALSALTASQYAICAICPDAAMFNENVPGQGVTFQTMWNGVLNSIGVGSFTSANYTSTPKDTTLVISWDTAKAGIFENYSPKNNKLFNAPYTKLRILNNMGEAMDLSPEYFGGFTRQPQDLHFYFKVFGFLSISPDLVLYPTDYLGSGADVINPNYRLSIAPYPQLPHNENSFTEWLQQNNISNSIKGAQGLLQVGFGAAGAIGSIASGGALAGASLGMAGAGISQLAGLGSSYGVAKANGISTNIPNNTGAVASGLNLHKFSWQLLSLRYYDANSCDDYMSKYGYAFNGFGIPSFTQRSKWDYVKAEGASFSNAPVPAQAQREIINRLNSGLRMWHGDYLGDYSQNNAIA